MVPTYSGKKSVVICDNFFLGGPVTFRGFEFRGVGPNTDGSFLGAKVSSNSISLSKFLAGNRKVQ
jgi:outer membrane protein assembly factor BamA